MCSSKNTYYNECPYCGSKLDPGEKCDCKDRRREDKPKPIKMKYTIYKK